MDTLFHMVVARRCRKFGEGDIGLSEGLASDWRVNNFDLLRLLAALQVAAVHSIGILQPTGCFARLLGAGLDRFPGVPIFFVISGVLISKSYEHSDSLRDFLRNRCLRIFPGLWVCLVVSVAVILALGVGSLGRITAPDWLLWWAGQMSIFQNFQATFLEPLSTGLNRSLWTIPIELEFYIVLPALYGILRLRRRLGNMRLLAIALASLAVQLLIVNSHRSVGHLRAYSLLEATLAPYLWMFLVGVSIQRNWSTVRGWLYARAHWWGLGYLMLCAAARWLRVDTGGNNISPVYLSPPGRANRLTGDVCSAAFGQDPPAPRCFLRTVPLPHAGDRSPGGLGGPFRVGFVCRGHHCVARSRCAVLDPDRKAVPQGQARGPAGRVRRVAPMRIN